MDGALAVRAVGGVRFGCTATKKIIEDARQREQEGLLKISETVQELTSRILISKDKTAEFDSNFATRHSR